MRLLPCFLLLLEGGALLAMTHPTSQSSGVVSASDYQAISSDYSGNERALRGPRPSSRDQRDRALALSVSTCGLLLP